MELEHIGPSAMRRCVQDCRASRYSESLPGMYLLFQKRCVTGFAPCCWF